MTFKNQLKRVAKRLRLVQLAAWGYELYRQIRRPHTHGALVAIWSNNKVLLVQTSYRKGYGLPGGGLQNGESAREAAARELDEELGISIKSSWLQDPWTISERQPGGLNTVTIFALLWDQHQTNSIHPPIEIDQLEIIAATWMSREQALNQHLPNHLRQYLVTYGLESKTFES